jgi:hypothetical protein
MTDLTESQEYGTRWRVVGLVLVPCLAALTALGSAFASGALALSFVAESETFDLATKGLEGDGFGIAVVSIPVRNADGSRGTADAARIGVATGRINGLCIAHPVNFLGKAFTLLITGGDDDAASYEINANGLLLDLTEAKGVIANQGDLAVNKNAADVRLGGSALSLGGPADRFGLQGDHASLRNIVATVRAITIPDLHRLPNVCVRFVNGTQPCPAP